MWLAAMCGAAEERAVESRNGSGADSSRKNPSRVNIWTGPGAVSISEPFFIALWRHF